MIYVWIHFHGKKMVLCDFARLSSARVDKEDDDGCAYATVVAVDEKGKKFNAREYCKIFQERWQTRILVHR